MILWNFTKWIGRVSLWLLFWPLGLWRSYRHGQDKRDQRMAERLNQR